MPRKQALKLIFLPTNNQIKVACLAHQDTLKLTYIILEFQKFSGGETPGLLLDGECHYPTSGSHGKVRKMRDCGGIMRRRGGEGGLSQINWLPRRLSTLAPPLVQSDNIHRMNGSN